MGSLELILGPMYAGKSTELLRRTNREIQAGRSCQLFKPKIDDRYDKDSIATHDKIMRNAIPVSSTKEIAGYVIEHYIDLIGIDELQFLDDGFIEFSKKIVYDKANSLRIIASALATDFRGEPFKFMKSERHIGEVMPYSQIHHEYAVCKFR